MKFITYDPKDPETYKVLVTAKYAKVDVSVVEGTEADAKASPDGTLPYLDSGNAIIFGSHAAARYVAKQGKVLYGANEQEAAQVESWIDFAHDLSLPASVWVFPILGLIPNNSNAVQKAKGDIRKALEQLNHYLQTRTFLVGQRLSLADVVLSLTLHHLYARVLDVNFRKGFINTNRWFLTCINQPEFVSVIGSFKLCEKMEVAKETEPTGAEGKKEKKEEKPKEAPKPKETPKPKEEKKPKKKDDDEEEEESHDEPKKKTAMDSLPPSKLVMDEWKRQYSNTDTRKEALPWFWEHFDAEGYSIWFGNYKYNSELEKLFMTRNFVGGFIQRMDHVRKYCFGNFILFGEEPKLEVACCLMFRGKEIPEIFREIDDYEHYEWSQVDLSDPKQKALVEDYWAWNGEFGGRKFLEGKTFK